MTLIQHAPDLTQATAPLITMARAVKGKRGFVTVAVKKQRSAIAAFRITPSDAAFIDNYCQKYGITRTELFQRSLTCYTGYDGKNGKALLK